MAMRQVVAGITFVMPEGEAARAREEGERKRRALNPNGQAAPAAFRKVSVVDRLCDEGKLRDEQRQAAQEIEAYWHRWTASLFSGTGGYSERLDRGFGAGEPPSVHARAGRYQAWATWAEGQRLRGDLTLLALTLAVCVDGLSPWAVRQRHRISAVGALRHLQVSLREYAVMSGWVVDDVAKAA